MQPNLAHLLLRLRILEFGICAVVGRLRFSVAKIQHQNTEILLLTDMYNKDGHLGEVGGEH